MTDRDKVLIIDGRYDYLHELEKWKRFLRRYSKASNPYFDTYWTGLHLNHAKPQRWLKGAVEFEIVHVHNILNTYTWTWNFIWGT